MSRSDYHKEYHKLNYKPHPRAKGVKVANDEISNSKLLEKSKKAKANYAKRIEDLIDKIKTANISELESLYRDLNIAIINQNK